MNQYENLEAGLSNIALFGLNPKSWDTTLNLARSYEVLVADFLATKNERAPNEMKLLQQGNLRLCQTESELNQTGVYYVDGFHLSNNDWSQLRSASKLIGKTLRVGDWIVFGPKSNPDLMETVILDRVMELSGLRLGIDFQVSFCQKLMDTAHFQNSSDYLRLSHNLIVEEVNKIFNSSVHEGISMCKSIGKAV